ncbi:hypothetical protein L3Q82_000606 [Scortum barcoo]|uniref:Uncharacterized protein n=1 Tax=Scortum barcoo TaxID=214431 RepID=A0ACB8WFG7_9TELE|nr:hypothetical protein L3Q82_000606 [Scortum barcoo]
MRSEAAESKRWAVIFACLSTRAVHLEVIESTTTSGFINALRRFLTIRGRIKHLRPDRGMNFIGACRELQVNKDDPEIKNYLQEQGCTLTFNAPHSSHMGGAWERLIGVARRILDALLVRDGPTRLTHEVLTTLMAEVMAIMNSRPLVPISYGAEIPEMLSPATLLTQKASVNPAPPGNFELDHLCKVQWRQVQSLADSFWKRWRLEYLATLQPRRKWTTEKPDLQEGDIVLIKDSQAKRNEWPLGRIVKAIPKVMVKTLSQGFLKSILGPLVMLFYLYQRPVVTEGPRPGPRQLAALSCASIGCRISSLRLMEADRERIRSARAADRDFGVDNLAREKDLFCAAFCDDDHKRTIELQGGGGAAGPDCDANACGSSSGGSGFVNIEGRLVHDLQRNAGGVRWRVD